VLVNAEPRGMIISTLLRQSNFTDLPTELVVRHRNYYLICTRLIDFNW